MRGGRGWFAREHDPAGEPLRRSAHPVPASIPPSVKERTTGRGIGARGQCSTSLREITRPPEPMKAHQQPAAVLALILLPLLAAAAPRKPAFTLELLAPATDVLGGQTDVRVGITSAAGESVPSAVYCSLGGPPAVPMTRDGDSEAWMVTLDTTLVPNGPQQLEVITNDKRSKLAVVFTSRSSTSSASPTTWSGWTPASGGGPGRWRGRPTRTAPSSRSRASSGPGSGAT